MRVAYVLCRTIDPLLMNEVDVAQGRLPVREDLKQDAFGHELQCGSDSIVTRIKNVTVAVLLEFAPAQLEQANIRPGALLGVEAGLDLRHGLHESEVESQEVGYPL